MTEQEWTTQRLLNWTTDFFTEKKVDSPRLAAEVLLAHCLHCGRIDLYTRFDEIVAEEPRAQFRSLVKRHASGEPVAYLVGKREFYSLSFKVDASVLIPRPETETLVTETLDRLESRRRDALHVCDVGVGSGAVAICLAKYLPQSQVLAIDCSRAALAVASENAQALGVADRVEWLESDLLTQVKDRQFDAIVSNPPYVSESELEQVSKSVKDFEPRLALVGAGVDGGDTTRRLIDQSVPLLKPGGWLLVETSPMLADKLKGYLEQQAEWSSSGAVRDSAGQKRVVWAQKTS